MSNGPRVETQVVPACIANSTLDEDALCQTALTNCPDEGDTMYWVYRRVEPDTEFRRVYDPPYVCRGADEPVDPREAVAGVIAQEFARVVVQRGVAEVQPAPRSLVQVPTRFETSTVERYDIPLTLLGQSVVITAQAERWTWHVDAGRTVVTQAKSTRGRVEHTYTTAGPRRPYVVITWSGTYSVNGEQMGAVPGTVTTQGEPVDLDVRQARSELVSR